MCFVIISNKATHPLLKAHEPSIFEFCFHFSLYAMKNVSFITPVVSLIAGRVLHFPDADIIQHLYLPAGYTGFAFTFFFVHRRPIKYLKMERCNIHVAFLLMSRRSFI